MGIKKADRKEGHERQQIGFCSSIIFGTLLSFAALSISSCQLFNEGLSSGELLDKRCLYCFCYSMSKGCNYSYGCHTLDKPVCGPYQMSYPYWLDGGKPGKTNNSNEIDDFIACANNHTCAEKAMQNYNRLYYKDCNGNGIIDCVDFFRVHIAGPNGCNTTYFETGLFWLKFLECYLNTAENTDAALRSIRTGKPSQNRLK